MFKIIKKGANNFWHVYNNDAKNVSISDFEIQLDEVSQTFNITLLNGGSIPQQSVSILDIEVIDETDASTIETFTDVVNLRARLVELGYTAYLSANGIHSVVAGTNVTIDNTDPTNPIINATGGGGTPTLQQVLNTGKNAELPYGEDVELTNDTFTAQKLLLSAERVRVADGNTGIDILNTSITRSNGTGSTNVLFEEPTGNGDVVVPDVVNATETIATREWVNANPPSVTVDADDVTETATRVFVTPSEKTAITHANRSILDAITESFTTALKNAYDGAKSNIDALLLTGSRLITSGEITMLSNTSGTNSGDETTASIQTKRPLKTINSESLEGSGNIVIGAPISRSILTDTAIANVTTAQNFFSTSIDLAAGKQYSFQFSFTMTGLSGTAHTLSTGFGGTAVLNFMNYQAIGGKASNSLATQQSPGHYVVETATMSAISASNGSTTARYVLHGLIDCTTAGTFIPQFQLSIGTSSGLIKRGAVIELNKLN